LEKTTIIVSPLIFQIMHDLDKILSEEYSQEYGFLNEGEYEGEWEGEYEHEGEYEYEGEYEGEGEWEWEGEYEYEGEVLNEQMEYELAAELLTVSNEEELEQFLGRLVKRVGRGIGRFAKSGIGRKLIGGLKSVARVGLPMLGKVAGTFFGGPVGGTLGGKLGSLASRLFEIQGEGMSNEDLEFEVARRYVRLAASATRNTARNAARGGSPKAIVSRSIKQAAAKHAPGLLRSGSSVSGGGYSGNTGGDTSGQSGSWSRQGNQIVLYGV
jgi:hypothetical protein